jgi:flagellin
MINALTGSLDATANAVERALSRMGSGSRINSASDDPAGLQIANRMSAQISGLAQALNNLGDGASLAQTAAGSLGQISSALLQMRDLAVQSANGTNNASDRQALQAQFAQLTGGIDTTAQQTQFNGQKLLDGTFNANLQSGPNAGDTVNVQFGNATASGLSVSALDISTAAGSNAAVAAIDQALQQVGNQQASAGALQSGFESTSANLLSTQVNTSASLGRLTDSDYAQESSNAASANVKQAAALKAIALYNANQANVLALLPGQGGGASGV